MTDTPYRNDKSSKVFLSVVLPVYNEEEIIAEMLTRIAELLDELGASYEIIAVNDGSSDGTAECLDALEVPHLRAVHFRRNYGQTAALMAGFQLARGEVVVALDADGQNDPEDIPRLVSTLDEGYDVVSGWRKDRKDAAIRRNLLSRVANRFISYVSGVSLHDYGCTLKAYRRDTMQGVQLYGEMHRFIPIYAKWNGGRVTEIPVKHHSRKFGQSKYGMERTFKVLLDLIVVVFLHKYAQKPMHLFGMIGLLSFLISGGAGAATLYYKFVGGKSFVETPLPMLFAVTFITGCMCVLLGLLAELMTRTYHEAQAKPTYMIARIREGTGARTGAAAEQEGGGV